MCTIAAIESDMGWYYLSCKVCSKKVLNVPNDNIDEQGDEDEMGFHYYCVKCKVKNPRLMPRYKLHLVVLDNTGNSKFLLFDAIAMQILNRPCNELTGSNFEKMQDPGDILLALKDLNGTYKVLKIVTNTEMITEFEEFNQPKGALTTLAIENSVISDAPEGSFMLNYQSSQECEAMKVTPAKCRGGTVISLEEHVEENSVTRYPSRARIKIEKARQKWLKKG
ncbi:hypothetical protein F2Q69_00054105 [Brassica cretica]|uniref:Replication factor A C-terminal domain-containing protein n=1 Tax=Brassica cretica TaxID=69181 RepID=A0A8S9MRT7_BRACR|nr:hypothetical protein F2Q69_00054105 [Brassica cretica]